MSSTLFSRNGMLLYLVVIEAFGAFEMYRHKLLALPESASFLLAILAITFAIFQFRDSSKLTGTMQNQSAEMKEQSIQMAKHSVAMGDYSKKMGEISKEMTTRSLGPFPNDIDEIVPVVKDASTTLLILADYLDYGRFTKPEGFDKYNEAIRNVLLKRTVAVKILMYSKELARDATKAQFPEDRFLKMKSGADERGRDKPSEDVERYLHFFRKYPGVGWPTNYESFLDKLAELHQACVTDLFNLGAEIKELDVEQPLFFWIEDAEDTVFAFQNVGKEKEDLAFRTRDPKLIETFTKLHEERFHHARPYQKPCTESVNTEHAKMGDEAPDVLLSA